MKIAHQHHILMVTGPAGCGKSTVAKYLAQRYGFDYVEGDDVSMPASMGRLYTLTIRPVPPSIKRR